MRALKISGLATAALLLSHCSSEFAGNQAGFGGGGNPNKTSTNRPSGYCDPKIQRCNPNGIPEEPPVTKLPPGLSTDSGGVLARNVRQIYFSGNGPGSAGGVFGAEKWGASSPECLTNDTRVPSGGLQGDCFPWGPSRPAHLNRADAIADDWNAQRTTLVCYSNRIPCSASNTSAAAVTTNVQFLDVPCKDKGMLDAGPAGERYHVLGIGLSPDQAAAKGLTPYSERYLCRNAIAADQITKDTQLVTEVRFMSPGKRLISPAACPAEPGWEQIGVIPDCVAFSTAEDMPTDRTKCSGSLSVCQKKEKVTFNN